MVRDFIKLQKMPPKRFREIPINEMGFQNMYIIIYTYMYSTTDSRIQSLKKRISDISLIIFDLLKIPIIFFITIWRSSAFDSLKQLQTVGVKDQPSCYKILEYQLKLEILFGTCIPVTTAQWEHIEGTVAYSLPIYQAIRNYLGLGARQFCRT